MMLTYLALHSFMCVSLGLLGLTLGHCPAYVYTFTHTHTHTYTHIHAVNFTFFSKRVFLKQHKCCEIFIRCHWIKNSMIKFRKHCNKWSQMTDFGSFRAFHVLMCTVGPPVSDVVQMFLDLSLTTELPDCCLFEMRSTWGL